MSDVYISTPLVSRNSADLVIFSPALDASLSPILTKKQNFLCLVLLLHEWLINGNTLFKAYELFRQNVTRQKSLRKYWNLLFPHFGFIFSSPEFSQCFRKTVFVWGPCLVLWILLPFHFSFGKSRKDEFQHSLLSLVIDNCFYK